MYIECILHPRWNLNEQTRENTVTQNIVEKYFHHYIYMLNYTTTTYWHYHLIFDIIIPFYFAGNFQKLLKDATYKRGLVWWEYYLFTIYTIVQTKSINTQQLDLQQRSVWCIFIGSITMKTRKRDSDTFKDRNEKSPKGTYL